MDRELISRNNYPLEDFSFISRTNSHSSLSIIDERDDLSKAFQELNPEERILVELYKDTKR